MATKAPGRGRGRRKSSNDPLRGGSDGQQSSSADDLEKLYAQPSRKRGERNTRFGRRRSKSKESKDQAALPADTTAAPGSGRVYTTTAAKANDPYDSEADNRYNRYEGYDPGDTADQEAAADEGDNFASDDKEEAYRRSLDDSEEEQTDDSTDQRENRIRSILAGTVRRHKFMLLGSLVGLVGSIIVLATVVLLPIWAIEQLHSRVSEQFMDKVDYAMEEVLHHVVGKWIVEQLPSLQGCRRNVVTPECFIDSGNHPLTNLYRKWAKGRADIRLETRFNSQLRVTGNTVTVLKRGNDAGSFEVSDSFSRRQTSAIYKELLRNMDDVSEFRGIRDRWLLRNALRAYGVRWCILLCDQRDRLDDLRISHFRRIKLRVAVRVASTTNARVGAFFLCAVSNCSPDDLKRNSEDATIRAARRIDNTLIDNLVEAINDLNRDSDGNIVPDQKLTTLATERAIGRVLNTRIMQSVLNKIGISVTARSLTKAIPIAGQIYAAIELVVYLDYINTALEDNIISNFIYEKNLAEIITYGSGLTAMRDETRAVIGNESIGLAEAAAVFQVIQGYPASRTIQAIDATTPKSTIFCEQPTRVDFDLDVALADPFEIRRVPDTSQEQPVLMGEEDPLACPDLRAWPVGLIGDLEDFRNGPSGQALSRVLPLDSCIFFSVGLPVVGSFLDDLFGSPCEGTPFQARSLLRGLVSGVNSVIDWIGGTAIDLSQWVLEQNPVTNQVLEEVIEPVFETISEFVGDRVQAMFFYLIALLFPSPVRSFAERDRLGDQAAATWDAKSNVFGKGQIDSDTYGEGIGDYPEGGEKNPEAIQIGIQGEFLDADEQLALDTVIREERFEELQSQSLFARYFDLSNHASLASSLLERYAMSVPLFEPPKLSMLNPLSALGTASTSLGFTKQAFAATAPAAVLPVDRTQLFGITQYGYSLESLESGEIQRLINLPLPEFNAECDALSATRSESWERIGQGGRQEVPTIGNSCALIRSVVGEMDDAGNVMDGREGAATKAFALDSTEDINAYWERENAARQVPGAEVEIIGDPDPATGGLPILDPLPPGQCPYPSTGPTVPRSATTAVPAPDPSPATVIYVHTCIAGDVQALLSAAAADGIRFSGWGWRDNANQIRLRRQNCGTSNYAIYHMPSGRCSPPTARPGRSQHERGLAIDFTHNGRIIGSRNSAAFRWLAANAATYGLINLPSEPWHWSTSGR